MSIQCLDADSTEIALILLTGGGLGLYYGLKATEAKGEDTSIKNVISNSGEAVASALGSNETETASSTSQRSYSTVLTASALSSKTASVTKEVASSAAPSVTDDTSAPGETSTVG